MCGHPRGSVISDPRLPPLFRSYCIYFFSRGGGHAGICHIGLLRLGSWRSQVRDYCDLPLYSRVRDITVSIYRLNRYSLRARAYGWALGWRAGALGPVESAAAVRFDVLC